MLRWMAPFLSFTAEEAWPILAAGPKGVAVSASIFTETFLAFEPANEALLAKWSRLREIRDAVNKEIEAVRTAGGVGSSLQAGVRVSAAAADRALLAELGDELRFVLITSAASVSAGDSLHVEVTPSADTKCDRCWHYRVDVGADPAHPTICGRCVSNLFGSGETRRIA
jgi:isoleucyl-tRNA synthetase